MAESTIAKQRSGEPCATYTQNFPELLIYQPLIKEREGSGKRWLGKT